MSTTSGVPGMMTGCAVTRRCRTGCPTAAPGRGRRRRGRRRRRRRRRRAAPGAGRSPSGSRGARRIVHRRPAPAVAEVRPVGDVAVAQQHDVLQAVTGHVGQPDPRVGEVDVGPAPLLAAVRCHARRGVGVVEPALQPRARAQHVGQPVAVEVDQLHARVGRAGPTVPAGRAGTSGGSTRRRRSSGSTRSRLRSRSGRRGHDQVGAAVAVGVDELHAGLAEGERRRLGQRRGAARSGRRRRLRQYRGPRRRAQRCRAVRCRAGRPGPGSGR